MKNRRLINMISFGILGLVACIFLIRFLGFKLFKFNEKVLNILDDIAVCAMIFGVTLSAFNFTISRRNQIFNILLATFLAVALIFCILMF